LMACELRHAARALRANFVHAAKSSSPLVALTPNHLAPRITKMKAVIQTSLAASLPGERSLATDSL
jgi:hypothetical protein